MEMAIKSLYHMKEKARTVKKSTWIIFGISSLICIGLGIYAFQNIDVKQVIQQVQELPLILKYAVMVILISLQIFLAFLPGEPLELASGYLFGAWQGTIVCMIGSCLGTVIVYMIVKKFKRSVIEFMFEEKQIHEMNGLFKSKKGMMWTFILFLIPGSPKDVMTYLVSLGNINLLKWLLITTIGRIPSIVTSTYLTGSLKDGNLTVAFVIGIITILLVAVGTMLYKKMIKRNEKGLKML